MTIVEELGIPERFVRVIKLMKVSDDESICLELANICSLLGQLPNQEYQELKDFTLQNGTDGTRKFFEIFWRMKDSITKKETLR